MTTKAELESALKQLPDVEEANVVVDRSRLIGTVVSARFHGQNQAERQIAVFRHLRLTLGEDLWDDVEFVFTNTPEEYAALTGRTPAKQA